MSIKTIFDDTNEFSSGDFAEANKQMYDSGILCPFGESALSTNALKVTNSSGNALIGNGSAIAKGRIITVTDETVALTTDGTYKIVLEWSAAADGSALKALNSTETLVQTDTLYQILLATVIKSGTSLTITDGRTFINRMTDNQAIPLQTAIHTGWFDADLGEILVVYDISIHSYRIETTTDISNFIQTGSKVKYAQDSIIKYATVSSVTQNGEYTVIALDPGIEINALITEFYVNNFEQPMGYPAPPQISSGTWSPTIGGETAKGTMTFSTRTANYYKIGNQVHCEFLITGLNLTGSSGVLAIQDLPFAPATQGTVSGILSYQTIANSDVSFANIGIISKLRLMTNGQTYFSNTTLSGVGVAGAFDYICQ